MDLKLDDNNDLAIENGDFVIEDTTYQDAMLILVASPGWFKNDPVIGANIMQMLHDDESMQTMRNHAARHLQLDGKELINFNIVNSKILIDVQ